MTDVPAVVDKPVGLPLDRVSAQVAGELPDRLVRLAPAVAVKLVGGVRRDRARCKRGLGRRRGTRDGRVARQAELTDDRDTQHGHQQQPPSSPGRHRPEPGR